MWSRRTSGRSHGANPMSLLKTLTDLMKTQFMATLDLELPEKAEGDND